MVIDQKKYQCQRAGFTFTELMLTALLTGLLATAILSSITNMMKFNQQVDAKVTRQQELSRSLDFIGDEVKRASNIATTITLPPGVTFNGNPVNILSLTIPNPAAPANDFRVIYYLRDNTTTWLGPRVLYRWGPPLDQKGFLTTGTPTSEALVDLIDGSRPTPNPACPSGWTANPARLTRQGVYTCVSNDGRQVNIVLRGQVLEASGKLSSIYQVQGEFVTRNQAP